MTIYDIARKAGVAGSTVSRVLNGQPGISDGTRKRILAIAEAEGFALSENARSLKLKSSMLIGILVSDIRNQHYTEGAYVMVEEFQRKGYCSIIMNAGNSGAAKIDAVRMLSSRRVDGAVFIGSSFSTEEVAKAVSTYMPDTPIVMENGSLPLDNVYTVAAADSAGLRSAVEYLAGSGCRSLAYINANDTPSNRLKRKGVEDAVSKTGLSCIYMETTDSFEGGRKATLRLLEQARPDAVVYSMDILAAGGVRAILDSGLAIPDDISVFGVDNSIYSAISNPSISSVDTSLSVMSAECVRILESAMAGIIPEKRKELPFSLVIRESTR